MLSSHDKFENGSLWNRSLQKWLISGNRSLRNWSLWKLVTSGYRLLRNRSFRKWVISENKLIWKRGHLERSIREIDHFEANHLKSITWKSTNSKMDHFKIDHCGNRSLRYPSFWKFRKCKFLKIILFSKWSTYFRNVYWQTLVKIFYNDQNSNLSRMASPTFPKPSSYFRPMVARGIPTIQTFYDKNKRMLNSNF